MAAVGTHADALRLEKTGVEIVQLRPTGTVPGVIPLAAAGRNGPGSGRLRAVGDRLQWRAPGSGTFGAAVECGTDGNYQLEDGEDFDKWLRVQVVREYLLTGSIDGLVELADVRNNEIGHDDVTSGEAAAGDVTDYTVEMTNVGTPGGIITQIVVWLEETQDNLQIQISDDGIAWDSPTIEADGLAFPDLAPGASNTLHVRRTITAGAEADPDVLNFLHVSFCGL